MASKFTLYSDGGGEKTSAAAGACILHGPEGRTHLVAFLGRATNNEAEICGGLLGYSLLHALYGAGLKGIELNWVCDSEYVLKSATGYINTWQKNGWKTAAKQPVKNRALWHAFLELSQGIRITPEHVRGHSGHVENEACDVASTWAQNHGEEVLETEGNGAVVSSFDDPWYLFDGRPFLETLRCYENAAPPREDCLALADTLRGIELKPSNETSPNAPKKSSAQPALITSLKTALRHAQRLSESDPKFARIQKNIRAVLAEVEKE